ncbi:MAG: MFS transporter [Betaproteobacteria bacterium]
MTALDPDLPSRYTHPIVFLILMIPFGVMGGYLVVAVAYQLSRAGLSVESIAELVAVSFIPHTWKFLWAPVVDTTLTRKTWYLLSGALSAVGVYATGAVPAEARFIPMLYFVVLVSNLAVTFLSMSVESLMVYGTPPDRQGRAGGWFQAGNLGGYGLGGGAGLWLAERLSEPWITGAVLGMACAACALALAFVREAPTIVRAGNYASQILDVLYDLWQVLRSRLGMLALLICFLPIGAGAASGLWSAVADDWRASSNTVALVNGVLSGLVSAAGCLVGGFLSDRMDRKSAYALYGFVLAVCAVAMALAPRTEIMFIVFTTVYAFIQGLTYAGFSAVTLEAIGLGAAATKYTVFAALSNVPIMYMTLVDGAAQTRWGSGGMLYVEALFGIAGLLLFAVVAATASRSRGQPS